MKIEVEATLLQIDAAFDLEIRCTHGKEPNENELRHRWRERASRAMDVIS